MDQLTERTQMVILVHLYGNVIDVLDLRDKRNAAGRPDILILEDAAQAHGVTFPP